jgi:large subunit ribosomal protein L21
MYAIVATGGKQYRVQKGDVLKVEKLSAEVDAEVTLGEVLLVNIDGEVQVGAPYVTGTQVRAKVLEHGKGKKVIAFRYKPKKHVRVKRGHRQPYTKVLIESIGADTGTDTGSVSLSKASDAAAEA